MLDDSAADSLKQALCSLTGKAGSTGAWEAIPSLSRLAREGIDLEIDLRATDIVGAPVVIVTGGTRNAHCLACLTRRQKQVAGLLANGLSNAQISDRLGISVATTKDHVHAILKRLGVDSRGKAAALINSSKI